jgi:glycolate oxidase FAD binding subunit
VSAVIVAADVAAVQEAVREAGPLIPVAGGTLTATHPDPDGPIWTLDVGGLRGVVDYDPAELTFTARPGTPLAEVEAMLAANGQHLPFDPPRLGASATLGGAVAAGVTGPGGFAAGIRDFVIGVRLVDGNGRLAKGGGKVVKNAAGFDLPKLMVGSLGRLGIMVELSVKVFPRPAATATVRFPTVGLGAGLAALAALARGAVPVTALDLDPDGAVTARIGGAAELIEARAARLAGSLEPRGEVDLDDAERWEEARGFAWADADARLVVAPAAPRQVVALDADLERFGAARRYGLGANVAWIAWPAAAPVEELSGLLAGHGISAVALTGAPLGEPLLGAATGGAFGRRIVAGLDPDGRFAGMAR